MTEQEQRAAVIAEAESWLGTPYRHCATVKGHGCDCATLLAEVYANAGLRPRLALGNYPTQWHLHNSESLYMQKLAGYATEIPEADAQPGDIVIYLLSRARTWGHGGIILDWPSRIVHAVWNRSVMYAHGIDDGHFRQARRKFYTLWPADERGIA